MNNPEWLKLIHSRRQTGAVQHPHDAQVRLKKLPNIRAVVFDIYGTLFSSGVGDISLATLENRDHAIKETLINHGIHITDTGKTTRIDDTLHKHIQKHQDQRRKDGIEYPEVEIRKVWTDFIIELANKALISPTTKKDIETLIIDYESRVNPTQPMPELKSTLSTLRNNGLVMSIISNAQFYTPLLFESFINQRIEDLGFCLDCSVWSYQLLEGKPSRQLYKRSADLLQQHHNIQAHEVLYVGNDMRNDIWPAQQIGFKTALFAGDRLSLRRRASDANCARCTADLELTMLSQLLECI